MHFLWGLYGAGHIALVVAEPKSGNFGKLHTIGNLPEGGECVRRQRFTCIASEDETHDLSQLPTTS